MRRNVILALTLALSLSALGQAPAPAPAQAAPAQPAPAPTTAAAPRVTPEALWTAMLRGNKNFIAGKVHFDSLTAERLSMKDHQSPPVTVLSCSDSRVPPELVFDQTIGALFGIRTAGNTADEYG